jgi:hypothetical protein
VSTLSPPHHRRATEGDVSGAGWVLVVLMAVLVVDCAAMWIIDAVRRWQCRD